MVFEDGVIWAVNLKPSSIGVGGLALAENLCVIAYSPAIKVIMILEAIEQQYNIQFKTFYDDGSNDSALNNLFLWLHRAKGRITGDLFTDLKNTIFNTKIYVF